MTRTLLETLDQNMIKLISPYYNDKYNCLDERYINGLLDIGDESVKKVFTDPIYCNDRNLDEIRLQYVLYKHYRIYEDDQKSWFVGMLSKLPLDERIKIFTAIENILCDWYLERTSQNYLTSILSNFYEDEKHTALSFISSLVVPKWVGHNHSVVPFALFTLFDCREVLDSFIDNTLKQKGYTSEATRHVQKDSIVELCDTLHITHDDLMTYFILSHPEKTDGIATLLGWEYGRLNCHYSNVDDTSKETDIITNLLRCQKNGTCRNNQVKTLYQLYDGDRTKIFNRLIPDREAVLNDLANKIKERALATVEIIIK